MRERFFQNPWWVVVGSFLGLIVSSAPMLTNTIGTLVKPISTDLGWTRSQVTLGLAFSGVTSFFGSVILGVLMDRYGVRRVAMPCVFAFALIMSSIGFIPPSLTLFTLMYALAGLVSAGIAPLPYAKSVAATFDRQRGLALGIAIAGVGIGTGLVPQYAQSLVEMFGWRGTYMGLGLLHFVIAFPVVLLLLRDPQRVEGQAKAVVSSRGIPGSTFTQALVSGTFWLIAVPFMFTGVAMSGLGAAFVPMLTDAGMSARLATTTVTALGFAIIAGRISSGFLLDRLFAPYVVIIFLMIPFTGIVLFSLGGTIFPFIGAFLIGIGLGGELDLMAFLVSRYFGLRAFGAIYGLLTGGFFLGARVGPLLISVAYDKTHSYGMVLFVAAALMPIGVFLISRLGKYVYPAEPHAGPKYEAEVPAASRP